MNPFSQIKDKLLNSKIKPMNKPISPMRRKKSVAAEYSLDFLNTSKNISGEYYVNISCYTIIENDTILYLLENLNNILYFPHFKSKTIYKDTISKLKKLSIDNFIYKGYVINNNILYMIFELSNDFTLNYDETHYILATIYEITFKKKIFIYDIHRSVFSIFLKYPIMNNLYYDTNIIPLKEVCYYKSTNKTVSFEQNIGIITKNNYEEHESPSIINTIIKYLLNTNKSYEDFLKEINKNNFKNLHTFLKKEGDHFNIDDITEFITTIDSNNSNKIEKTELINSIEKEKYKDEGLIKLSNNDIFNPGVYLRVLTTVSAYNIASFNKKNKTRTIFINNIDNIKVLSRHNI